MLVWSLFLHHRGDSGQTYAAGGVYDLLTIDIFARLCCFLQPDVTRTKSLVGWSPFASGERG